ncbi:hypothetical protein J0S82_012912, partial [Galemys pyrenaicus]
RAAAGIRYFGSVTAGKPRGPRWRRIRRESAAGRRLGPGGCRRSGSDLQGNCGRQREASGLRCRHRRLDPVRRGIRELPAARRVQLLDWLALPCRMDASSSPWNPTPAPVSSPSLLLPIPAIVFIAVGVYLLLLGLVLLTRHCLLVRGLVRGGLKGGLWGEGTWLMSPLICSLLPEIPSLYTPMATPFMGPGRASSPAPLPKPEPKAVAQTAAPPAGSRVPPGPRTVAGPAQKPVTSLCQAQPATWMPAVPSLRKLAGPLAALAAAHSVTVPVRANFLTARASTVSALRSSSDEESSLPFGEWPAPGAHMPSSLKGLRTPFSRQLEPQMAHPAHQPRNQQWRTWLPAE